MRIHPLNALLSGARCLSLHRSCRTITPLFSVCSRQWICFCKGWRALLRVGPRTKADCLVWSLQCWWAVGVNHCVSLYMYQREIKLDSLVVDDSSFFKGVVLFLVDWLTICRTYEVMHLLYWWALNEVFQQARALMSTLRTNQGDTLDTSIW